MRVARQFIAWYRFRKRPVPSGPRAVRSPNHRARGSGCTRFYPSYIPTHAALDFLPSIPTVLSQAGMLQALVKPVRLLELGDANRVGAVPTALE